MDFSRKKRLTLFALGGVAAIFCLFIGIAAGLGVANVQNIKNMDNLGETKLALPTEVLDAKGRLITEYFATKRELVKLEDLPKYVVYALITREDQNFFHHHGFSVRGTLRAFWNLITGNYISGGSTITQQLAGTLYADRSNFSIFRKLKELWWALQLERKLSKDEILELYLNRMLMGPGVYGIQAASEFFFGHPAKDLTIAESAMLVIQLANPSAYNPYRFPNRARDRQRTVLNQMVKLGYATQQEVDASFDEFWKNYDYSYSNTYVAQDTQSSKAPYFTEYVRNELQQNILLGTADIYSDGYIVHTTLNLDDQKAAEKYFDAGLARTNAIYEQDTQKRVEFASKNLVPMVDLLSLAFDIPDIRVADRKREQSARSDFQTHLAPMLDIATLMFGQTNDPLRTALLQDQVQKNKDRKQSTVQGALITLDNDTGHILAMIGGSNFEQDVSEFNYAVDGRVQPGSSFKPLYYSAGIEKKVITPATMILDTPVSFTNPDGTPYTPENYRGEWTPPVSVRTALINSMNVPSIRVLDMIGFTDAFKTATRLLGIPEDQMLSRGFERRYPVGLGTVSVSPLEMARAYATFANQGHEVIPIAIRYVEDRNGKIIAEPEKDTLQAEQRKGSAAQIISPQTAYIMTNILESTVKSGTLEWAANYFVGGMEKGIPFAGKTGTTQNWSSVWTMGFSPYMTTALWFGFDKPGRSLGINQTGAVTTGPVWAQYMKAIHEGLPPRQFPRPTTGLVEENVTADTGLLPPPDYKGDVVKEIFIKGTEPKRFDQLASYQDQQQQLLTDRMQQNLTLPNVTLPRPADESAGTGSETVSTTGFQPPVLDLNLDLGAGTVQERQVPDTNTNTTTNTKTQGQPDKNNLLD